MVLDLVRYPDYDNIHRSFRDFRTVRVRRHLDDASAGCGCRPRTRSRSRTCCSVRLRVPAARLAADDLGAPLRVPRGPAGRPTAPFDVDHQGRPRHGRLDAHDFGAGHVAGEPIFVPRSPDAGRGRRLAAVASSTRRPSTARGWWCWTRATSSPSRSRSRTCATTCRSASTARSRSGSRHDRRRADTTRSCARRGRPAPQRADAARASRSGPRPGSECSPRPVAGPAETRRKCVRAIRRGDRAYVVSIRSYGLAEERRRPNPRRAPAHPRRDVLGRRARAARRGERQEAMDAVLRDRQPVRLRRVPRCGAAGRPTRAKIEELHRGWFEHGDAAGGRAATA